MCRVGFEHDCDFDGWGQILNNERRVADEHLAVTAQCQFKTASCFSIDHPIPNARLSGILRQTSTSCVRCHIPRAASIAAAAFV